MAGLAKLGALGGIAGLGGTSAVPAQGVPKPPPISAVPARPEAGFRRPTLYPQGPTLLGLGTRRTQSGGPGAPPPGFLGPTVSNVEWVIYWSSSKLYPPFDPRQPPFTGDRLGRWDYQSPSTPGQVRELGSTVSDFVYHIAAGDVIVRLDTWYYHIASNAQKHAFDRAARQSAYRYGDRVVTLYDTSFINDETGNAAVRALADAISGREILSPVSGGTAFAVRDFVTVKTPS